MRPYVRFTSSDTDLIDAINSAPDRTVTATVSPCMSVKGDNEVVTLGHFIEQGFIMSSTLHKNCTGMIRNNEVHRNTPGWALVIKLATFRSQTQFSKHQATTLLMCILFIYFQIINNKRLKVFGLILASSRTTSARSFPSLKRTTGAQNSP